MAVRVLTTTRVCLSCKINSDANAGKEFHEIFDEVGLELQLPYLVETFLHINLNKRDKQHVCDDCVNRLIELYDLDEHAKEESCKANKLKNKLECSYNKESSKHHQNESGTLKYERENFHKPLLINQNNTQANLTNSNSLEHTNVKTFDLTQEDSSIEINKRSKSEYEGCTENKNVGYFFNQNRSVPFDQQQNQSSNVISEDCAEEDFDHVDKREVSQDCNISLLFSAKSEELQSNEHIEFISDDKNHNEGNKHSNTNIIVGSKKLEINEPEASHNFNISFSSSSIKCEKSDELESNEDMEFISDDENQNVEIKKQSYTNIIVNVDESEVDESEVDESEVDESEVDESEQAYTLKKTHENEYQKDICVEEVDDRSNQVVNIDDSNSLLEELKITELNNIDHIGADEQTSTSDDTCSLEEENLIEKIILSEEFDQVDLNEYLDKVLITEFQNLRLNCEMECKLCLEKYYSFGELLKHACMVGFEKEQQLSCIIKDCEKHAKDLRTLARHLILTHYDKLESTTIYSKCTDCQKKFSNVLDFNKHSCCRNIKQKIGAPKYCKYCDLDLQSSKRYAFHMQFHLKTHRPKICLLCGDVFNNSNDFFEHTQYTHIPESALTCERCDRFFKDIQVFNNHMKFHDDAKYQHKCAHCPKKYTTKFALNRHTNIYHTNKSKAFKCEYCPKQYDYKRSYLNHIKTHAADAKVQTIICLTCGLITRNMEMIKEHIESKKESPCFSSPFRKKISTLGYSCENCSLEFCKIKHLKAHRLSDSHSDDFFYCGMCKKSFVAFSRMRFHSYNNNECKEWQKSFPITRHFVCNIGNCREFTTSWSALCYHKKNHHKIEEKWRELKCQFCQQSCTSKKFLADHVAKIHNNAKFTCSHCKAKFPSKYILLKHIDKKHTPVECDICLKKFKHRRNFEVHTDVVHNNIKRYFCKHCQKGYFRQKERDNHEKKHHPHL